MINCEYNIKKTSAWLDAFILENELQNNEFRRRAVIVRFNDKWVLVGCTVEVMKPGSESPKKELNKIYKDAILHEDWLNRQDCLNMVCEIEAGKLCISDLTLTATDSSCNWSREQVPLFNQRMSRAGYVLINGFHKDRPNSGPLVASQMPYYPSILEAGKHWLPNATYSNYNESSNGAVAFFLPESRAYLKDAKPKGDQIVLHIEGSKVDHLGLRIVGAWWERKLIRHFDQIVEKGTAVLKIPMDANRVEYVLMGDNGIVYDFQREDEYGHLGLGRSRLSAANGNYIEIVKEACRQGEGETVEFKPFIRLDEGFKGKKLEEVVKTIVAFANSKGGRIFFGIDDECNAIGIDEQLQKWAKTNPTTQACENYLNAMKSKIRDNVIGDPLLDFLSVQLDCGLVAIIEVKMAAEKPIEIGQDHSLYIRRGASNAKAFPREWKNVIGHKSSNPLDFLRT